MTGDTSKSEIAVLTALLAGSALLLLLLGLSIVGRREALAHKQQKVMSQAENDEARSMRYQSYSERLSSDLELMDSFTISARRPIASNDLLASSVSNLANEAGVELESLNVTWHRFDDQTRFDVAGDQPLRSPVTAIATEGRASGSREELTAFLHGAFEVLPDATDLSALELRPVDRGATNITAQFTFYTPVLPETNP